MKVLASLAVAMIALTSFGAVGGASAQELPTIKIQAVKGSVGAVPLMIMVDKGLDKKHGFKAQVDYLPLGSGFQSFVMGQYDVSNDTDVIRISQARAEGFNIQAFYPYGDLYMGIVVGEKSTAKTVEDLKGKRVGHFGLQSGTTNFLRLLVQQAYGFDLTKSFDLQQVGPAALVPMLESGNIEAMLNFEPLVSAGMVATKGRYLLQATEGYKKANDGYSPWFGLFASSNAWLTKNPKLAYAFRDAIGESISTIQASRYALLKEPAIASQIGVNSPEVLDQLVKNADQYGYFTNVWTAESIAKAYAFTAKVAKEGVLLTKEPDKQTFVRLEDVIGPRP